jgi:MinD superfamily P-loop ATPase
MKVAIASGKGGTGKTTIATNLALTIAQMGTPVQYLDCDVEEPNGHIFLKPVIEKTEQVTVSVPDVDLSKCTGCGNCGRLCQYSAIICLKDTAMTFEQLCHSCGGCMLICPEKAISEKLKVIGLIEQGNTGTVNFVQGRLQIGDVRSPALIKRVKQTINGVAFSIIDAPPGTSCPVIEAIKGADFVLLVTEPTPFGLNDLQLAVEMVRELGLRFAVIINRCDIGDDRVIDYCKQEDIDILLEIPDDRLIAEAYSKGITIINALKSYEEKFIQLYEKISTKAVVK